jgi:hypothetical protein
LESLASDNLYLHVAQKSTDENVIRLFKELTATATSMGTKIEFSHKKVEITSKEISWEHEVFARKNIQTATLSKSSKPITPQLARSSALDLNLDSTLLKKNIKLIAEALGKFVYGTGKEVEIFNGSLSPNDRFLNAWKDTFSQYSRSIPFTSKSSEIVTGLKTILGQFASDVTTQEFEPKTNNLKFYGNGKIQLSVYKVKPLSFDLLLLVPIVAYILGLHIWLVGFSNFKNNLASLFQAPNKRK